MKLNVCLCFCACLTIIRYNKSLKSFIQSYESEVLDAAVLIAPLVFFCSPNDNRFLSTLERILKSPEKGGLTSAGMVFRYDHSKMDDGTYLTSKI